NSDFELVFDALHGTPDNEAFDHLRRLRECPDVEPYARTLRKARLTTRNWPSDQLNDLMEYGALCNLFPTSTQPQDQQDDNQNMFLDPIPTTDYTSPSRQPSFMIDPRLGQKTLYNSSGQRWFDSTEPLCLEGIMYTSAYTGIDWYSGQRSGCFRTRLISNKRSFRPIFMTGRNQMVKPDLLETDIHTTYRYFRPTVQMEVSNLQNRPSFESKAAKIRRPKILPAP
ncbi:hypothetical protein E4T44_12603, partial [Aureobasidium sp. EXF-8845]